jgi:hypothetical protein
MAAALEAAKVGNARPWSSYERYEKDVLVTSIRTISRKYEMYSEARCGPLLR